MRYPGVVLMGQLFWDVRAVVEVECPETGDYLGLEPTTPMMLTQRKK